MDEGGGGDQEEAGEAGRQAGLQLPQLSQFLNCVAQGLFLEYLTPDVNTTTATSTISISNLCVAQDYS